MGILKVAVGGIFMPEQQQVADATSEAKRGATTTERVLKLKAACKAHSEQVDGRFVWIRGTIKFTMMSRIHGTTRRRSCSRRALPASRQLWPRPFSSYRGFGPHGPVGASRS